MTHFPRTRSGTFGAALVSFALLTGMAQAQGRGPVVQVEVLPGWSTDRGTRIAALHLTMTPGWHTYWRIPGDAGIAPRFDWGASQNVASVVPIWPRPQVFDQNGYRSYGYADELILPVEITPQDPAHPMVLGGMMAIGVCAQTCVPADVSVSGVLRGSGERDARISAALDTSAQPGARGGLSAATCRLEPARRGAEITLRATLPQTGRSENIVLELPGSPYRVMSSETWREGGDLVTRAMLRAPRRGDPVGIDRASVAFTVLSEDRMLWSQGCTGG
ncbi:MAG: protein-disulfide reductase DsbD domain-containing protein [Pararhodobacter sp.]